jgi:glycosyltransferase involved in cell wall biosynthesis
MEQLTVIIPVLNGMPYLKDTLASLEAQSYRNFFVLLWDNGSTDGTVEEASRWIPQRLPGNVVSDRPLELHLCLAEMVKLANTEFVARMDADDIALPNRFEKQLRFLCEHTNVLLVGSQMELINQHGDSLGDAQRLPDTYGEILFSFLRGNAIAHPTVMFRREAVLAVGNYDYPKPAEDYDLWMRLAITGPMANLPTNLLKYRRHPNAVCGETEGAKPELQNALNNAAGRNAKALFGLNKMTLNRLRLRKHPLAIIPLGIAARRCAKRAGISTKELLCSPDSLRTARYLTSQRDYVTKAVLRAIERLR